MKINFLFDHHNQTKRDYLGRVNKIDKAEAAKKAKKTARPEPANPYNKLFNTPSPIPLFQAVIALSIIEVPQIISVLSPFAYCEAVLLAFTTRKNTGYNQAITMIAIAESPVTIFIFSIVL